MRSFIGLVKYYKDVLTDKCSHFSLPLTVLTSKKLKSKWKNFKQKEFNEIKRIVTCDNLLIYPYFNKRFDIHKDAIEFQPGSVIRQTGKPIAFYIRKLKKLQQWYTVIKKELLSIVETLKEFCTILLGQKFNIYIDHKNITCKNVNTDIVLQWRFISG